MWQALAYHSEFNIKFVKFLFGVLGLVRIVNPFISKLYLPVVDINYLDFSWADSLENRFLVMPSTNHTSERVTFKHCQIYLTQNIFEAIYPIIYILKESLLIYDDYLIQD